MGKWLLVIALYLSVLLLLIFYCGTETGPARVLPYLFSASVGATIAVLSTYLFELSARRRKKELVKDIVYQELLFLVFRCAWDFETPWSKFWDGTDLNFSKERVQKFRPDKSLIIEKLGADLSLIDKRALARLLRFMQSIDLWRRDLEHTLYHESAELFGDHSKSSVDEDKRRERELVRRHLARRLGEAVQIGWSALEMMRADMSKGAERIDSEFRASLAPRDRKDVADPDFIRRVSDLAKEKVGAPLF